MIEDGKNLKDMWETREEVMIWHVTKLSYICMLRASEYLAWGVSGKGHPVYCLTRERISMWLGEIRLRWEQRHLADRAKVNFVGSKGDTSRIGACLVYAGEALAALIALLEVHPNLPPTAALATYIRADGTAAIVTRERALVKLREMLRRLGIDSPSQFALHSGRVGGATQLYTKGATDREIQVAGRWSKNSFCFVEYLRGTDEAGMATSKRLMQR
jgi:hypothetical protein